MNEIDFFHGQLDASPGDSAARMLLAESCAERSDDCAEGFAWLSEKDIMPQDYRGTQTWDWNDKIHFDKLVGAIPHELFAALESGRLSISESYREYPTRRIAEAALCMAFLKTKNSSPNVVRS